MKPHISVVIPAYNEEDYIGRCLEALEKQKECKPFEVIVVDNASTDRTVAVAKTHDCTVVSEPIKGVSRARRTGALHANGDILAITDADAAPPDHWLAKIESYLDREPELVAVSGNLTFYDRGWWFNLMTRIVGWIVIMYDRVITRGRCHITAANSAVRKSVYDKAGGFDPELAYGEDMDLSRRLWKYGRVLLTPKIKTIGSARRFQPGKGIFTYIVNFAWMSVTGNPWRNELTDVRKLTTTRERIRRKIRPAAKK